MILMAKMDDKQRGEVIGVLKEKKINFREGNFLPREQTQQTQTRAILSHEKRKVEMKIGRLLKRDEERLLRHLKYPINEIKCSVKNGNMQVLFYNTEGKTTDIAGDGELHRLKSMITHHLKNWKEDVDYIFDNTYTFTFNFSPEVTELERVVGQ